MEKIFDHIEKSGIFGRRNVGEFLWNLVQITFVTILNQSHREWFEGTMIGARFAKGGEFATALQVQHFRSLGTSNVKAKKRWKTERAQARPQVRSHSTEAPLESNEYKIEIYKSFHFRREPVNANALRCLADEQLLILNIKYYTRHSQMPSIV